MSAEPGRTTQSGRALVLGSAGDIGSAVCRRAASKGWEVLGIDRLTFPEGQDLPGTQWALDLSLPESLDELSSWVRAEAPTAVICALGAPANPAEHKVLDANFTIPVRALDRVVTGLKERSAVTVVSSVSSTLPSSARSRLIELLDHPDSIHEVLGPNITGGPAAYSLAKGALREWTLQRAAEYVGRLRFNVVSPISTTGRRQAEYARSAPRGAVARGRKILGRDVSPDDVADAVAFLTLEPGYWWLNGADLQVDGGLMNYLERGRYGR